MTGCRQCRAFAAWYNQGKSYTDSQAICWFDAGGWGRGGGGVSKQAYRRAGGGRAGGMTRGGLLPVHSLADVPTRRLAGERAGGWQGGEGIIPSSHAVPATRAVSFGFIVDVATAGTLQVCRQE